MKRKTLFLWLALAALVYLITRWWPETHGSFLAAELVAIDTGRVTVLFISPQEAPSKEILLKREGKTWIATQGTHAIRASLPAVNAVLAKLSGIKTHRAVGKGPEIWTQCGLNPGQGIRIRALQDTQVLDDFFIGGQEFIDGEWHTYVRLNKDDEVFAVSGELATALSPGFDAFRSKTLLDLDLARLTEIRLERVGADSGTVFLRKDTEAYLQDIKYLQGDSFANAFDPLKGASLLEGRLIFFATEWEAPVEVAWYRDTLREKPFIFYSTANPDNYFSSDSAGLFQRLVMPLFSFSRDSLPLRE